MILTASNTAYANEIEEPRFFNYRGANFSNRLVDLTFGWFKTFDDEEKLAYNQSITQALEYADNGQVVRWYKNNASGMTVVSATWPGNGGYCRRVYIQAIAHNVEKTMKATACFNEVDNRWTWHN